MLNRAKPADIAVDLGTSKIAVHVRGDGLVATEPAVLAMRGNTLDSRHVVAFGREAELMIGKTPQGMRIIRPVRDGVVCDGEAAGLMLDAMLARLRVGGRRRRRRYLVGALYGATGSELRAFEQVAQATGAHSVRLVAEPFAAAVGADMAIDEPRASMVVDIGGGATEAVVVSLKRVVSGGSIRIGGEAMCAAVAAAARRHAGLLIGEQEARRLGELVSTVDDPRAQIEVRGRDARMHLPRAASIPAAALQAALAAPVDAIVGMVRGVVNALSAELAADLIDRGIILAGGGAASRILRQKLEREIGIATSPMAAPESAVIKGCGRMLDYYDFWAAAGA